MLRQEQKFGKKNIKNALACRRYATCAAPKGAGIQPLVGVITAPVS